MLLTDLVELKRILEINPSNTAEDIKLNFFVSMASEWILDMLNRRPLAYAVQTEYYNGTGTQKLLLKRRPVRTTPTIVVRVDPNGFYNQGSGAFDSSTALTYGDDFALWVDPDNSARSRNGILIRTKDVWYRPQSRMQGFLSPFLNQDFGSIQVTYGGGYQVDDLPAPIRLACNLLVTRLRYLFPLGMELGSESYEERSIGLIAERKDYLTALIKPMIQPYIDWNWGGI